MPTFGFELDDGRTLKIEADDENSALKGLEHWKGQEGQKSGGGAAPKSGGAAPLQPRSLFRDADDFVRTAADTLSFGQADRLAGYMSGEGLEAERRKTKEARERLGVGEYAADVAGSLLPFGALGRTAQVASRVPGLGALGTRSIPVMVGEGAVFGGGQAAGHGEDPVFGGVMGGAGGAAGALTSRGIRALGSRFNPAEIPEAYNEIAARAQAAYARSEAAGVAFNPNFMTRLRDSVVTELTDRGYHPALSPALAPVLRELDRLSSESPTLKGVDVMRQMLESARTSTNPRERLLGGMVAARIDEAVERAGANDLAAGVKSDGLEALQEARRLWQVKAKTEDLAAAAERAERTSDRAGTDAARGQRAAMQRVLERRRNWTPEERAALEEAVRGSPGQNALQFISNFSPGHNRWLTLAELGTTAVNPMMAGVPAAGFVARMANEAVTRRNAQNVLRAVQGIPMPQPNALQSIGQRADFQRALSVLGAKTLRDTQAE